MRRIFPWVAVLAQAIRSERLEAWAYRQWVMRTLPRGWCEDCDFAWGGACSYELTQQHYRVTGHDCHVQLAEG